MKNRDKQAKFIGKWLVDNYNRPLSEMEKEIVKQAIERSHTIQELVAALYLIEFEFMKNIGTVQERLKCGKSELFGMGDIQGNYINSVHAEGEALIFQ